MAGATIVPTRGFVARLLPAIVAEGAALVVVVFAYLATGNWVWFLLVPVIAVALLVWIVYLLRAHREGWRWANRQDR